MCCVICRALLNIFFAGNRLRVAKAALIRRHKTARAIFGTIRYATQLFAFTDYKPWVLRYMRLLSDQKRAELAVEYNVLLSLHRLPMNGPRLRARHGCWDRNPAQTYYCFYLLRNHFEQQLRITW